MYKYCRRFKNRSYDCEVINMNIKRIMAKAMAKSGGAAELVEVPAYRRPTAQSLRKLEKEVAAQVSANEAMRSRSMQNAGNTSRR